MISFEHEIDGAEQEAFPRCLLSQNYARITGQSSNAHRWSTPTVVDQRRCTFACSETTVYTASRSSDILNHLRSVRMDLARLLERSNRKRYPQTALSTHSFIEQLSENAVNEEIPTLRRAVLETVPF